MTKAEAENDEDTDLITEKSRLVVEWFNGILAERTVTAADLLNDYKETVRVYELELARMKELNGITREWNRVHQDGFEI